jgi:hypothetical protein
MHRMLAAVALLCLASPAFAETPGAGNFGLGASLGASTNPVAGGGVTLENALNARYFITREILVSTAIGLSSTEKVGTLFSIAAGCSYYFLRGPGHQLSPFVGGAFGIVSFSPSAANVNSSTGILFLLGGGLEYFFNQSFSIQVSEGLQLSTKPTNFAFVTRLGLTLFI